jgi:hypothetical protein
MREMADDELSPGALAVPPPAPLPVSAEPAWFVPLVRLALAIEFLLAWITALTAWSILAGQFHIDSMDWRWKVALPLAFAFACVRATVSAMRSAKAWNRGVWIWVGVCAALATAMGLIAWYTHLQEPPDEDEESGYTAVLHIPASVRRT